MGTADGNPKRVKPVYLFFKKIKVGEDEIRAAVASPWALPFLCKLGNYKIAQRARDDAEKKVAGVPVQNLPLVLSVSLGYPPMVEQVRAASFSASRCFRMRFPHSPQLRVVCISTRAARGAGGRRLGSGQAAPASLQPL